MADTENTLILETTQGPVTIEMRPDLAPGHVARIKELVREGFYDGLKFHRDGRVFIADYKHGIMLLDPVSGKVTPYLVRANLERFKAVQAEVKEAQRANAGDPQAMQRAAMYCKTAAFSVRADQDVYMRSLAYYARRSSPRAS